MEPYRLPGFLKRHAPWLGLAGLSLLVFAAYYTGLKGPFLLDDWGTLPKLGAYGPVDNFTTFISYITSGNAGPGGRPIALLSFLIDAHNWPANPWFFKLTNVILHLMNGVVLAWLLQRLGRAYGLDNRKSSWAAALGAGLWLAHPLFISTTLYVVQRMTMLAAFFVFAGLALYVTGRQRLANGRPRSGYALMLGGIAGGTILGFFSKENAALLPLLALVLEITVLRNPGNHGTKASKAPSTDRRGKPHPLFTAIFLGLPSLVILSYLLWQLRHPWTVVPGRDFSVMTRLLTEPRVLLDYLQLLVVPQAQTHGLYTSVSLSRGLLQPWTTLPSILFVLALVVGAFLMRRRWTILAAAILFFFAGQLLESTSLPLELYYEHRNYLPAALLFWPLAVWCVHGNVSRSLRYSSAAIALIVLVSLTTLRADLWGNSTRLALDWMRLNPHSARAIVVGTNTLEALGKNRTAYTRLRIASEEQPANISLALSRVDAACRLGGARKSDIQSLVYAAGHDWSRSRLLYQRLMAVMGTTQSCPGLGIEQFERVVNAAGDNPYFHDSLATQQNLAILRGRLKLEQDKSGAAYRYFESALALHPEPAVALTASAYLLNAGQARLALDLLDKYKKSPKPPLKGWNMVRLHQLWLQHIGWYRDSFRLISQQAETALQKAAGKHAKQIP